MKKKTIKATDKINGIDVTQDFRDSGFPDAWELWRTTTSNMTELGLKGDLSLLDFLILHIEKEPVKRPKSSSVAGVGALEQVRILLEMMQGVKILRYVHEENLRKMVKQLEERENTSLDPANILFTEPVYTKKGKKREVDGTPVYGHWRTAHFVKHSKKFNEAVPKTWYNYAENKAKNPPHLALYSETDTKYSKPKGLLYIIKDALDGIGGTPVHLGHIPIKSSVQLQAFPQVTKYMEGLLTSAYFPKGVINYGKIQDAVSSQKFKVENNQEELIRRNINMGEKNEQAPAGKLASFGVNISNRAIEGFIKGQFRGVKRPKIGQYYIKGKAKGGKKTMFPPIKKSWMDILWRD